MLELLGMVSVETFRLKVFCANMGVSSSSLQSILCFTLLLNVDISS